MDLFMAATNVTVGNGNTASFWQSSWLQGVAPVALCPSLFKHSKKKNRSVNEAMTESKWIQDVDYNMTEQLIAEFYGIMDQTTAGCPRSITRK
jgi:hypothetical protein